MLITLLTSLLGLILSLNMWLGHQVGLSIFLGLIYLCLTGTLWGQRLKLGSLWEKIILGNIGLIAGIIIISTIGFYLGLFNKYLIGLLLIALPWVGKTRSVKLTLPPTLLFTWQKITSLTLFIILAGLTLYSLYYVSSPEAMRTPWQVVLPITFLLYALTAGAWLFTNRHFKTSSLIVLYLTSLSVLPLVYILGYGFDPFIHQATAKILATTGTIDPKPLYYIGQYVVVVMINWLTALPINLIDKWLLPILTSLIVPVLVIRKLKQTATDSYLLGLAGVLPLIFLLNQFSYTTPQSLANLFALILIFTWFKNSDGLHLPNWFGWLIALAALAIHPLTGLPMLALNLLWQIQDIKLKPKLKNWLLCSVSAGVSLVIPLAFGLMSWLKPSGASIMWSLTWWQNLARLGSNMVKALPLLSPFTEKVDAVYLWGGPLVLIIIGLAAWGWYRTNIYRPAAGFLITSFGLLTLSYLFLNLFTKFPNLPVNEQNFYTERLWELALLCLWPLALYGGYQLIHYFWYERRAPYLVAISMILILTASFYLTYPRLDAYQKDTGYNTTPYDVAAVKLIEEAEREPYVTLSNQAVAAAAVSTYGFNKYFGENFYYPLPTGTNPLYQIYLQATEKGTPSRDTIKSAYTLTGAKHVYLVLNKYWADFDKLITVADSAANANWTIGQGRIKIYRYDFSD